MSTATNPKTLTRLAFSEYFMVGVGAVLFAPLIPAIIDEFGLSLTVAGLLFPAMSLGGMAGGLGAGPIVDRYGTKPVVLTSIAASATGLFLTAASPTWLLVLVGFALLGLGQRALGTCLNTLVAKANPDQSGTYLNYLHAVYGTGALLAPLVIGLALMQDANWRWMFAVPGMMWLVFGVLAARPAYPDVNSGEKKRMAPSRAILRSPLFVMLFWVAFCYNGIAFSLLGWVKTYLDLAGTLHPFLSTSMISIFYVALTLGRFTCGMVARRIGYTGTILVCAAGTALTYPLVLFSELPLLFIPGVFCTGLFLSGLYPTALAIANQSFKERAGTVTGVLTMAMTAGSMLPPWWTGAIADLSSFRVAMGVNAVLVLLLLFTATTLVRLTRASEPESVRASV